MSRNGVKQLKDVVIRYSDYDGSSRGIRAWMQQDLIQFARSNPDVTITTGRLMMYIYVMPAMDAIVI